MHLSIRTALATAVKTIMPFAKTNAYMFRAILGDRPFHASPAAPLSRFFQRKCPDPLWIRAFVNYGSNRIEPTLK